MDAIGCHRKGIIRIHCTLQKYYTTFFFFFFHSQWYWNLFFFSYFYFLIYFSIHPLKKNLKIITQMMITNKQIYHIVSVIFFFFCTDHVFCLIFHSSSIGCRPWWSQPHYPIIETMHRWLLLYLQHRLLLVNHDHLHNKMSNNNQWMISLPPVI